MRNEPSLHGFDALAERGLAAMAVDGAGTASVSVARPVEINAGARVFASSETQIAADPEVVWTVLTAFEDWPRWSSGVKSMSLQGPVAEGTTFRWKAGGATITSTIREVERPSSIGWTGKTFGIEAVHVWRFEPRDAGTLVRTEESFDGPLARLLPGMMRKTLARGLDSALRDLKVEAERVAHQASHA